MGTYGVGSRSTWDKRRGKKDRGQWCLQEKVAAYLGIVPAGVRRNLDDVRRRAANVATQVQHVPVRTNRVTADATRNLCRSPNPVSQFATNRPGGSLSSDGLTNL